jgi:hypothetical protein
MRSAGKEGDDCGAGRARRSLGTFDGLEDECGLVATTGIEVLGSHVGQRAVAFRRGVEPANALEAVTDQTLERVSVSESDADAEASFGARFAAQVVRMADVHAPPS